MDKILYYLYKKYEGRFTKIYQALQEREKVSPQDLENLEIPENWISLISDNYPEFMKAYYKPQFFVVKENDKYFVYYGKDLANRFEIPQDNENAYIELVNKYC